MFDIKRMLKEAVRAKTKVLVFVLLLIFYGSLLVHQINFPAAEDLGRHIKNGEMIMQGNFDVLYKNVYSYTEPETPFANHHWFFGVIAYLLHETVGFDGMVVFKTIVLLLAFAILFFTALKRASFWLVATLSLPTILVLMERTAFRPEIFSYLFIALYLFLLTDLEDHPERKRIFWLIPLQVLWVNIHIFFIIGMALVGGFLFEKIILNHKSFWKNIVVKKLTLLAVLLPLASILNPHGIRGVLLDFSLNIKGESPILISEDVSVLEFLQGKHLLWDISATIYIPLIVLFVISLFLAFRHKPIFYTMAGAGAAAVGLLHLRGIALFALLFLPAVSQNLEPTFEKIKSFITLKLREWERYVGMALIAILVLTTLSLMIFHEELRIQRFRNSGIGLVQWSNGGGEFFNEQHLKGPVFNDADVGSYLIYHLYPKEGVFVDNRFGDAYSPDFLRDTYLPMVAEEEVWQERQRTYNFNTIFFYQYDEVNGGRSFLSRRINDPEWALVYADTFSLIFIRNTIENQDKIKRFHITAENAEYTLQHLLASEEAKDRIVGADTLYLLGRQDLAMSTYLDVVTRWPQEDSVWMIMGEIELQTNTPENSLRGVILLEKALSLGRKTAEVYTHLGLGYLRLEQLEKGREMLEKALKIDPERADAKSFLEQLENRLRVEGRSL